MTELFFFFFFKKKTECVYLYLAVFACVCMGVKVAAIVLAVFEHWCFVCERVFGSQVQRGASIQADGEGGSSLRPESRRLTALFSFSLSHT